MANNLDIILDSAFQAYNQGQYDQAEGLCREVLMAESGNGDALFLLGLIAYQSGALEPAADLLFQAVKLYPDIQNYTLTLASILYRQGHLTEALHYYEKYSTHPIALAESGFIHLQQKDEKSARQCFDKALKEQPNLPEARLGLALLTGDKETLLKLAKETNLPDAWYYLARMDCRAGEFQTAMTHIQKTGLKQPAYLIEKALIYENMEQYDKALELYRQAAEKNPHNPDIWTNQANIFKKRGELAAAENYYKRTLAQDAQNPAARHNLADLLFHQNRLAESLEQYRSVLTADPDNAAALYNLAIILDKTENYADALGIYFKLLFRSDPLPNLKWRIADSLAALHEQNPQLAIDFAKGWLKNCPKDAVASHTLAALQGQKEESILDYTKELYDDFSESYDEKMKELHNITLDEIIKILPNRKYTKALDIGCGTGAFGRAYHQHISHLTGIDLSSKMLALAKQTRAYETLKNTDISDYLSQRKENFDLIMAIDIMGYISKVDSLFRQVKDHLKKKGLFAFSAETTAGSEPILAPHGRYLYPLAFLEKQLKQAGLSVIQKKEADLRKEGKSYARGVVILATPVTADLSDL